jgi:hypothetical protein
VPGGGSNALVTAFAYNSDDQMTSQTDPRDTAPHVHTSYDAGGLAVTAGAVVLSGNPPWIRPEL